MSFGALQIVTAGLSGTWNWNPAIVSWLEEIAEIGPDFEISSGFSRKHRHGRRCGSQVMARRARN
jgi:hypothetical protein